MKQIKTINEMFTIGQPIIKSNPTNVYKLVIENMSGDGDAYHNTETLFDKEYEPLIKDILDLCNWSQKEWPERNDIEKRWKEVKSKHTKFFQEEIDESYEPIITRDVTDDDVICHPNVRLLTWFDDKGVEYKVNY
jgi:hypothetical protein